MQFISKIKITLRKSILDTQGKAVHSALGNLGYANVETVRIGKYIEVTLDAASEAEAKALATEMCQKLLANTVMEDFTVEVGQVK
jgi:phosphoribosylformylglycinamidine synthase PurS subunit